MKICSHLTCDRPADVWYHGPRCGFHADKDFGCVVGTLWSIEEVARSPHPVRPPEAASSKAAPVLGGGAPASPPPLSFDELEELLALDHGWVQA